MKPAARLQAAIDIATRIMAADVPVDAAISDYFRRRRYAGSKDRGWIIQTVYAVLRRRVRLGWWLDQAGMAVDGRSLLLAFMALEPGEPSKVAALFGGGKYAPEPLNEAETELLAKLSGQALEQDAMPERVRAECPEWAEAPLRAALGADFLAEMQALNEELGVHIRVNAVKGDRAMILERLSRDGFTATPGPYAAHCLRVTGRPNLVVHPLFKKGRIEIQDESSQVAAAMVGAQPGMQILDLCAGAGGKSLALAADMAGSGRVVAADIIEARLVKTKDRAKRAGLHNIETRLLKESGDRWLKRQHKKFDRVLVDAPCSGTGTWARSPDIRWRGKIPKPEALIPVQAELLQNAARLVKPGGRLIYATCSLLPDENQKQVAQLLEGRADYRLLPLSDSLPEGSPLIDGDAAYLTMTPHRHGTNGFFAAVLEREAEAPQAEKTDPFRSTSDGL